jgi:hypothetical protein
MATNIASRFRVTADALGDPFERDGNARAVKPI